MWCRVAPHHKIVIFGTHLFYILSTVFLCVDIHSTVGLKLVVKHIKSRENVMYYVYGTSRSSLLIVCYRCYQEVFSVLYVCC